MSYVAYKLLLIEKSWIAATLLIKKCFKRLIDCQYSQVKNTKVTFKFIETLIQTLLKNELFKLIQALNCCCMKKVK